MQRQFLFLNKFKSFNKFSQNLQQTYDKNSKRFLLQQPSRVTKLANSPHGDKKNLINSKTYLNEFNKNLKNHLEAFFNSICRVAKSV